MYPSQRKTRHEDHLEERDVLGLALLHSNNHDHEKEIREISFRDEEGEYE